MIIKKQCECLIILILCGWMSISLNAQNQASRYAANSVLAQGKWIQLKVKETAVYRLTYDEIKKMGFNDPSKIKIYGYGGGILEEDFTKPYTDDLPEITVWMNKGSDNVFNSGDYLLFYGQGTVKWTYNATRDAFEHQNNPYSVYGSYFITESAQGPKEMAREESYSNASVRTTIFDDYLVREKDSIAIMESGRELFGESFVGKNSQDFSFRIPGITNDVGKVCLSFAALSSDPAPVSLSIGGNQLISLTVGRATSDYQRGVLAEGTRDWNDNKQENITATVFFNATNYNVAYLNFIRLNMKRKLQFYNSAYTFFRHKESQNTALEYVVDNAPANAMIWNITDSQEVRWVQTAAEGNQLRFGANTTGRITEYVMVDVSQSFPSPDIGGEIPNQNLHQLPQTEMVVIVPETYAPLAEQLAEKHRTLQGLNVTVVQPEWIYNEFSSGVPDATAYRRFMKMFYDRATNDNEKPKYLLLFGDGFFDNRHLTPAGSKLNPKYFLLTYQVKESLNEENSPGTDDYFGFLDDNEGLHLDQDVLDIGIGRFPVSSYEQAEYLVNKVTAYMDNKAYGQWKNTVIFTADVTDESSFYEHASQADKLAVYMDANHPEYRVVKSYMDAFQPQLANGKRTYPDAKKKLLDTLEDGCFLMNYTGHGNRSALSGSDMMNISDIRRMNFDYLPLWITATCDFGWFDGETTSGGEEVILNKNSAGIALYTTSRVVYSTNNFIINNRLIQNIFSKVAGNRPCLGDIIRQSKKEVGIDGNKLNFVLLGDPALQLNYPEWSVIMESINGKPVQDEVVYFRALDQITMEGMVVNENGMLANDFTGNVNATVFDGKQTIQSVSSKVNSSGELASFSFFDYPNIVYKGDNPVENGHFSVSFSVPLDISYSTNRGKINFYASDETNYRDANGSFLNFVLAGTGNYNELDDSSPLIEAMYLNSESFEEGSKVNETPFFIAKVSDKIGINMTGSGLGHQMSICIDNNPQWNYALNVYYHPESITNGWVGFSIPTLPSGEHELVFRVWNIINHSSTDTLHFNVVQGLKPEIYAIVARPNPAKDYTEFYLEHDRPESPMEVEIWVYDLMGRSIWSHVETGSSAYLKSYPVQWDLTDKAGNRVSQGVYIYQATIKTSGGKEAVKSKKIIVLEQ